VASSDAALEPARLFPLELPPLREVEPAARRAAGARLERRSLSQLAVVDAGPFRHVELWGRLEAAVRASDTVFLVPGPRQRLSWDRATFLNHVYWGGDADVLTHPELAADVVAHVGWHAAVARELGAEARSRAGLLLGEAVASAFDVYLVGRLLGNATDSAFLETQVPAMTEAALEAGASEARVESLFEAMALEPERAFTSLRRLLFDTSLALVAADGVDAALEVLERAEAHPLACLLHHFALPTWVLFARAYGAGDDGPALELDRRLRGDVDELERLAALLP
jgi:hypothetical protein